ncbi:protein AAR2 homolog [Ciona intestinalis]
MDQETAKALFKEGACLLLQGVPEGTEFGMDWNSWSIGSKFEGVKMVPPGIHYVFYSAVSQLDGHRAPRTGFFHDFKRQEIVVKRWLSESEELLDQPKSAEEKQQIKMNLVNMDKNLAPYPYETLKKWISMSNHCTPHLVDKLSPECGIITSVLEMFPSSGRSKDNFGKDGLPLLTVNPTTVIRFSKIPELWYPDGAEAAEITKHSMDSSYVMKTIISCYHDPMNLLGELQFSFLCFILGQVMDAFDHWKKLVRIICYCENSLHDLQQFYLLLISVLYHQIIEIPSDFFVDITSSNNFLIAALSRLFSNIDSTDDTELKQRALLFRKHLTKKLKWKFNYEPDDCKPVVVKT